MSKQIKVFKGRPGSQADFLDESLHSVFEGKSYPKHEMHFVLSYFKDKVSLGETDLLALDFDSLDGKYRDSTKEPLNILGFVLAFVKAFGLKKTQVYAVWTGYGLHIFLAFSKTFLYKDERNFLFDFTDRLKKIKHPFLFFDTQSLVLNRTIRVPESWYFKKGRSHKGFTIPLIRGVPETIDLEKFKSDNELGADRKLIIDGKEEPFYPEPIVYSDVNPDSILKECAFMNRVHSLRGKVPYPEWIASLSIASKFYDTDVRNKAQARYMSSGHEKFNEAEFDSTYERLKVMHPYSCEKIDSLWTNSKCGDCPHFEKKKNPLMIDGYPTKNQGFRFGDKKKSLDEEGLLTYARKKLGFVVAVNGACYVKTEYGFYTRLGGISEIVSELNKLVKPKRLSSTELGHLNTKLKYTSLIKEDVEYERAQRVFIFKNGFFDFSKGFEFNPLDKLPKDLFVTSGLSFDYDPKAECPKFEKFLDACFLRRDSRGELSSIKKEERDLFLRYIGLSLFGSTEERHIERMLILYGTGANGKSTLMNILTSMFRSSSTFASFSPESVMKDRHFVEPLRRAKIGYCADIATSSFKKKQDLLKLLISKEIIPYRGLYKEADTSFCPRANLICSMNELPEFTEATKGFERRVSILEFENMIKPKDRNINLSKEIYKEERQGVFNLLLDSYRRQKKNRGSFRLESSVRLVHEGTVMGSPVADFGTDRITILENEKEGGEFLKDVYESYLHFARKNAHSPQDILSNRVFFRRLGEHFRTLKDRFMRKSQGMFIKGIILKRGEDARREAEEG